MRQNYKGNKRQKEEARKKKQEEKRNKKQGKNDDTSFPESSPSETLQEGVSSTSSENEVNL